MGLSVGLDTLRGLDIKLASLSLHSISLLLSTNVGALPRLPTLRTVSSTSPFSQLLAVSYRSRLVLRLCFRDLDLKDRLFLCKTAGGMRVGLMGPRKSSDRAREEEKSSVRQGMILWRNPCLWGGTCVRVEEFEELHCQSLRNSRSMGVALVLKLKTQRVTRPRRMGMLATMMATLFSMWLMQ